MILQGCMLAVSPGQDICVYSHPIPGDPQPASWRCHFQSWQSISMGLPGSAWISSQLLWWWTCHLVSKLQNFAYNCHKSRGIFSGLGRVWAYSCQGVSRYWMHYRGHCSDYYYVSRGHWASPSPYITSNPVSTAALLVKESCLNCNCNVAPTLLMKRIPGRNVYRNTEPRALCHSWWGSEVFLTYGYHKCFYAPLFY